MVRLELVQLKTVSMLVRLSIGCVLFATAPGCSESKNSGTSGGPQAGGQQQEVPEVLADFAVMPGDSTLVFQFVDPATGQFATTQDVAKVPEVARANVAVFSTRFPKGSMPPELVILADLTTPAQDGSFPFRLVSRYGSAELPTTAQKSAGPAGGTLNLSASSGADSVILFSTQWCPHCRRARDWLTSQGIPFVEKDVESDSTASSLLQQLGAAQGVPAQMLSSVPIFSVKGTLVMGFDQQKIQALLNK